MKLCTIVGIRKAGKTTTVTGLIEELKQRGYRVGTVKSVFCPDFTLDSPDSNTWRHKEAGADFVCLKGKKEFDYMMRPDFDGSLYEKLPADILLLEGEYELLVPRIVCAHEEKDARERITKETIALAGKLAEKEKGLDGLPVYHSIKEIALLADRILELPETVFPLKKQPMHKKTEAFCQCGCHKAEKKAGILQAHPAKRESPHIFLTGEKGVGKSTLLKRLLASFQEEVIGYETRPYEIEGVHKGYYLHSLLPLAAYENDSPVVIRRGMEKMTPVPETFEQLGWAVMREVQKYPEKLVMLDEIGKAEKHAPKFQKEVFSCLDAQRFVLGVLQKNAGAFGEAIAARPDVEVYEVTEENRDGLYSEIIEKMKK